MRNSLLLLFLSGFFFFSCKKEKSTNNTYNSEIQEIAPVNKKAKVPGMTPGTLTGANVYFQNGVYYTPFAGGLTFTNFTYPTNKFNYQNYSPFTPQISAPSSINNLLDFNQDGNRFTVILGTVVGGLVYKMSTKQYLDAFKTGIPKVSDYVTSVGGSSDGLIVHKGQFIIDHDAPLGIKIVDAATKLPTTSTGLPTLISGDIVRGNNIYYVAILESTNSIFEFKAMSLPDTDPKAIASYNATYSNYSSTSIKVTGSFITNDGTTYTVDDVLAR